tara:strand:+ start:670 stop:894 length:225 start_codon:yes stop_codon:yes gene_type:complete
MKITRALINKVATGDHLTTDQLEYLLAWHLDLETKLNELKGHEITSLGMTVMNLRSRLGARIDAEIRDGIRDKP